MRINQHISRLIKTHLTNYRKYSVNLSRSQNRVKSVHQLRVACRRLYNFFWVYGDLFGQVRSESWMNHFKMLVDNLSEARDLDVQLANLNLIRRSLKSKNRKIAGLDALIKNLRFRRNSLDEGIEKFMRQKRHEKLQKRIKSFLPLLTKRVKNLNSEELIKLGKNKIRRRTLLVMSYSDYAVKKHDARNLHKLRVRIKKLRFTIEALKPVISKKLNAAVRDICSMQKYLGLMHDQDVLLAELRVCLNKSRNDRPLTAQIKSLIAETARKRELNYKAFFAVWRKSVKSGMWDGLKDGSYVSHR